MVMNMAYYAFLDANNVVTEVIPGKDENDGGIDWEKYYGDFRGQICKRTSYNTHGGIHINGGIPFRKNYAGIGYAFDFSRDAFIPPKSFASWILNEDTCQWEAPVDMPTDGAMYSWNEATQAWVNG
jgi:hypothetical protein